MTVDEIFELRSQGRTEEAYEAARQVYAADKSPSVSSAMFWTAADMLKMRSDEGRMDEAQKIYMAMERLLDNVRDEKACMHDAMKRCRSWMERGEGRDSLSEVGPEHLQMGVWGEEQAVAWLEEQGYVILERDWRSKHRDIDIIAQQGDCIVFIEVKTRRNRDYGNPIQAVNYQKQGNLLRAINHYIHYRKFDNPWRFDVITIVGRMGTTMPEIEHIEDFRLNYR